MPRRWRCKKGTDSRQGSLPTQTTTTSSPPPCLEAVEGRDLVGWVFFNACGVSSHDAGRGYLLIAQRASWLAVAQVVRGMVVRCPVLGGR